MGKLKYYCNIYTGNSISDNDKEKYTFVDGAIPYISTKDIDLKTKIINYNNGMFIKNNIDKFKVAPKDSTLLCIEGGSAGKKIGYLRDNVCFVNKLCCFSNFNGFPRFLYYYLQSDNFVSIFNLSMTGLIGGVPQSTIKNISVDFPNSEKQIRIANYLDKKCSKIDEVIENNNREIELLEEYKKSLITKKVFGGIKNKSYYKSKTFGDIPKGWRELSIKAIFSFKKGLSITKEDLSEEGIPVISYGQIHSKNNNGISVKSELIRFVSNHYLENEKNALTSKGDIIFADTSEDLEGSGNCIFIDTDYPIFAGYHTIIAQHTKPVTKYYAYLFQTDKWRKQIRSSVYGVKLFSVTQKILKKCSILVPPLSEQKEIAKYLDKTCSNIDKVINYRKQIIDKLEEYKKSLIYEVVTGKKEV